VERTGHQRRAFVEHRAGPPFTKTLGAMTSRSWNIALWLGALLGVPVAFGTYVFVSYRLALRQGFLPFALYPEWYWFAAFAGCLIVGLIFIYFTSLNPTWLRISIGLLYLVVMAVGLLGVHLFVACASGDCI
jgi:hypothetical protein